MKMIGRYCFSVNYCNMFTNKTYCFKGTNLITRQGEARILNRLLNNDYDTLQYILLGTGIEEPTKNDTELGSFKNKKVPTIRVDLNNKEINCECEYSSQELEDVTEIGLATDTALITHDVFDELTIPTQSTTIITYTLGLETENVIKKWNTYNSNVYYCTCKNSVTSVYEENSMSGYHRKTSISECNNTCGSYYYEDRNNRLYIHTVSGSNPSYYRIYVKTK